MTCHLQQDPIRWVLVTNIYISRQPMFRMEFIDKWNLKKLATGLSLTKLGLSTGCPFCRSRAGTQMVTFISLYFYFYIFQLLQIFWNFGIICRAYCIYNLCLCMKVAIKGPIVLDLAVIMWRVRDGGEQGQLGRGASLIGLVPFRGWNYCRWGNTLPCRGSLLEAHCPFKGRHNTCSQFGLRQEEDLSLFG